MQVFLSYSRERRAETQRLADELEAEGFSVWWDTALLPGEHFREEIDTRLNEAKAVIIIWTPESVRKRWVIAEAEHGSRENKLLTTHSADLNLDLVPKPFGLIQSTLVTDTPSIVARLEALGATRSKKPASALSPGAYHHREALEAWEIVKNDPRSSEIRRFLKEFHDTRYADAAQQRLFDLESLAWKKVNTNKARDIERFLTDFPDGRNAPWARSRSSALHRREERISLVLAKMARTIQAIDTHLQKYPDGFLQAKANDHRAKLRQRELNRQFAIAKLETQGRELLGTVLGSLPSLASGTGVLLLGAVVCVVIVYAGLGWFSLALASAGLVGLGLCLLHVLQPQRRKDRHNGNEEILRTRAKLKHGLNDQLRRPRGGEENQTRLVTDVKPRRTPGNHPVDRTVAHSHGSFYEEPRPVLVQGTLREENGQLKVSRSSSPGERSVEVGDILEYSRLINANPKDVEAYFRRGNAFFRKGMASRAVDDYSAALKLEPGNPRIRYNRGLAYRRCGQRTLAALDLTAANGLANRSPPELFESFR